MRLRKRFLCFALLIDYGVLNVTLNTSHKVFIEMLPKAFLSYPVSPVEGCYYVLHMIMVILMIMVMNVHNLFPLSVKWRRRGRKWVVNVPSTDNR